MKMKKYILLLFIFASMIVSCDSYTDIHQEYLEGGEIVYLQKIDSIATYAGDERIKFKLWYNNGDRLNRTIVYYGNGSDSIVIDLTGKLKAGIDSLELIQELPEGNYNFEIINLNTFDQKSLRVPHFASSYGDLFRNSIKNRLLRDITVGEGQFTIQWFSASDNFANMEIEYNSTTGKKVVVVENVDSYTIEELPTDNKFRYRTFFYPEDGAIDSIPCEWSDEIAIE